jgi:DNA-binding SARP family transcriptional activator
MEFRILGPVGAWRGSGEVPLAGAKQRTVLAALLLASGKVVSDDRLTALLWGWDEPPATRNAQIYTYVSRLRQRLGPQVQLVRQRAGYAMEIGDTWFDLTEFERLSQEGHRELTAGNAAGAARSLRAALATWRGVALDQVTDHLSAVELPRLEVARLTALESRVEADLALGGHHGLVAELTQLVADHPVRERFRAQLMMALYRCDRQSDALATYHEGRRVLAEELGVDPGAALAQAHQIVLTGDRRVWNRAVPAMLPPDIPDFTGRQEVLHDVNGLVVFTGMAGAGKTALAVRAAHARKVDFPDGQLSVDLGGAHRRPKDPHEVLGSFLRALCAHETIPDSFDERLQLYRSRTAGRRILVLLDNAASAAQVEPLLPGGDGCQVLVTARSQLTMLPGARVIHVGPLPAADSFALLTKIIGADRVTAEPDAANAIVQRCGGSPLALRLAGGKLAANPWWPLARLAGRMKSALLDELPAVRAALSESYWGLPREVRAAFRRLGEPGATATLPEDLLEAMVDASLLDVTGIDRTGRLLYQCHDLVRLLAIERAAVED